MSIDLLDSVRNAVITKSGNFTAREIFLLVGPITQEVCNADDLFNYVIDALDFLVKKEPSLISSLGITIDGLNVYTRPQNLRLSNAP